MTDIIARKADEMDLQRTAPKVHRHISERIAAGATPAQVRVWLDAFYGWHDGSKYREMCLGAAEILYDRRQLELAKAALDEMEDE